MDSGTVERALAVATPRTGEAAHPDAEKEKGKGNRDRHRGRGRSLEPWSERWQWLLPYATVTVRRYILFASIKTTLRYRSLWLFL